MSKHKEKALELFESYYMYVDKPYETNAKQCAIITVDEILRLLWHTHQNEKEYRYWQEVKSEIEKL